MNHGLSLMFKHYLSSCDEGDYCCGVVDCHGPSPYFILPSRSTNVTEPCGGLFSLLILFNASLYACIPTPMAGVTISLPCFTKSLKLKPKSRAVSTLPAQALAV